MTNDSTKTATAAKASGDSSTANPTEAKTFSVALVNITDGTVSGHKAGCADLKRGNLRKHADDAWELTVADKAEAWVA